MKKRIAAFATVLVCVFNFCFFTSGSVSWTPNKHEIQLKTDCSARYYVTLVPYEDMLLCSCSCSASFENSTETDVRLKTKMTIEKKELFGWKTYLEFEEDLRTYYACSNYRLFDYQKNAVYRLKTVFTLYTKTGKTQTTVYSEPIRC